MIFWKKEKRDDFDVEAFINNYTSFAPKRYRYSHVKKMTNSFANIIGKGGYGCVYKGTLPDGCLVAVKVLKDSKSNGEDFINEVASMGRTSHVNIVTLLGFCYEGTKRALIYDYMPNGSLDKFIFDQESPDPTRHLDWKTLYKIALGIARGLEYLHRGCNTRILHFDIKPQNILLDKDFCPKISDFGLVKLWLKKESIVSMTGARGTAGYIAPEVFNRNFGGVSHKSDVYSYGMLILEMVGKRKNIDVGVSCTSEIYYPSWIYEDLELGRDLRVSGVTTEEEKETARKLILVSFWCIQMNPSDRPPMSEVVDMLEGNLQSVQIPPKPFLFSPARSPQQSSKASK
uniref:PR5-like receptor kinase n=1 Tax=Ziziphus jujuba TaxID=326968 RepID=A0A6P4APE8_ZIZJJ